MKLIIIILLFAATLLISCSDPLSLESNLKVRQSKGVIMPLAQGNKWVYKVTTYDLQNNKLSLTYKDFSIGSHYKWGDSFWFNEINNPLSQVTRSLQNRPDGLWTRYLNDKGYLLSHFMIVQYPIKKGDSFQTLYYSDGKFNSQTVVVEDTELPVSTSAGIFNCYYYKATIVDLYNSMPSFYNHFYYFPELGLVKSITFEYNSTDKNYTRIETELISFELK